MGNTGYVCVFVQLCIGVLVCVCRPGNEAMCVDGCVCVCVHAYGESVKCEIWNNRIVE